MHSVTVQRGRLIWRKAGETVWVEPWGADSLRVRATINPRMDERDWALLPAPRRRPSIRLDADRAVVRHGRLRCELERRSGCVRFFRDGAAQPLLAEGVPHYPARLMRPLEGELFRAELLLAAHPDERFYGLGQHQHGLLDQKGAVIDLVQHNTRVAIPFLVSSRGYGFLWNNPAIGRVELGRNGTRWVASATRKIDYWVTVADDYAGILRRYADATGHAPEFPAWAGGFWQCKLRYRTQAELLAVAREHRRRGLPLSAIVIDYFHWTAQGDWRFHPDDWPDPAGMVRELRRMGVELVVSVWPTVNRMSESFQVMQDRDLLVRTRRGELAHKVFADRKPDGPVFLAHYDATNPEARRFIWERVRRGYHRHGIRAFWLDACEPELGVEDHDHLVYHAGPGLETGCLYPMEHARAFYEGQRAAGVRPVLNLCRSAWAGAQRYGAAVWSGDITSTFESLQAQVRAGLNIGLSGIPWWTTDIGGFHGSDPASPYFRELLVRWFQYGAFCPLFRMHGMRGPWNPPLESGLPNEVWSFGDRVYAILRRYLLLRQRLRPYLMRQMRRASAAGTPPMRPLFFDFPRDPRSHAVEDQFLLGPDLLVAPVLQRGARQRAVYLPRLPGRERWIDAWTGRPAPAGRTLTAPAPLERIPVYLRGALRRRWKLFAEPGTSSHAPFPRSS